MSCKTIKKMLSEYLDNALDEKNRELVASHLASCDECQEAFKALEKLSSHLKKLPHQKAPGDFLNTLHQKMRPVPWWTKLYTLLFVPFKIKFPLELATATAAALLAFFVFTVQQQNSRVTKSLAMKQKAPLVHEAVPGKDEIADAEVAALPTDEKRLKKAGAPTPNIMSAEKTMPPKRLAMSQEDQAGPGAGQAETKTGYAHPPQKNVVALKQTTMAPMALFLDLSPSGKTGSRTAFDISEKTDAGMEKKVFLGAVKGDAKEATHSDVINQIKEVATGLGGKLVYVEHDPAQETPPLVQIHIPLTAYEAFCNSLSAIGTLRSPTPEPGENSPDPLKINIYLESPDKVSKP